MSVTVREEVQSGAFAWTDDSGRFYARGCDGVTRTYGTGHAENARFSREVLGLSPEQEPLDLALFGPVEPEPGIFAAARRIERILSAAAGVAVLLLVAWMAVRVVIAAAEGRL